MEEFLKGWDDLADELETNIQREAVARQRLAETRAEIAAVPPFRLVAASSVAEAIQQTSHVSLLQRRWMELAMQISSRTQEVMYLGSRLSDLQYSLMMHSSVFASSVSGGNLQHAKAFSDRLARVRALTERWSALVN